MVVRYRVFLVSVIVVWGYRRLRYGSRKMERIFSCWVGRGFLGGREFIASRRECSGIGGVVESENRLV